MEELISVIVPVYNVEKYLEHCIESILKQTYQNFELILVNDGSKDRSLEICKLYEEKDCRVRVFDRKNGGVSAARNTGLDQCNGTYIIFVDSDDYISQNCLENLYRAAKIRDYDIVQCDIKTINERLEDTPFVPFCDRDVREVSKVEALNYREYKIIACAKMYKSSLFGDFRFKEGIINEDEDSNYIFVDKAKRIALLNQVLYYYFMSSNSIMRNDNPIMNLGFITIYEDRIKYFLDKEDYALLEGSYCRYCIVLMLAISKVVSNKNMRADVEKLILLYKQNYPFAIKSKVISKKDKLILFIFRRGPKFFGRIIGRLRK